MHEMSTPPPHPLSICLLVGCAGHAGEDGGCVAGGPVHFQEAQHRRGGGRCETREVRPEMLDCFFV